MENEIKLNGLTLPVKFNYGAIKTYEQVTGESYLAIFEQIGGEAPKVTAMVAVCYAGLKGANPDFRYTIDTVAEWVMTMGQDELTKLFKIFIESFPQRKPKEEQAQEPTEPGK